MSRSEVSGVISWEAQATHSFDAKGYPDAISFVAGENVAFPSF